MNFFRGSTYPQFPSQSQQQPYPVQTPGYPSQPGYPNQQFPQQFPQQQGILPQQQGIPQPPLGGFVALNTHPNPYLNLSTGKYKRPTKSDIVNEMKIYHGLNPKDHAVKLVRIDDAPEYLVHFCKHVPGYSTQLFKSYYTVNMPGFELSVEYYVHTACKYIVVSSPSLSN